MQYQQILAKKFNAELGYAKTLNEHTLDVVETFKTLFGSFNVPTRLAEKWMTFFGIEQKQYKVFYNTTLAACYFHDIGKANSGFQNAIRNNGSQLIRHEHLSGLLIWTSSLKDLLASIELIDLYILFSSVISHHLKVNSQEFCKHLVPDIDLFTIYPTHILEVINNFCNEMNIAAIKDLKCSDIWSFEDEIRENVSSIENSKKQLDNYLNKMDCKRHDNKEDVLLLMAVRSALIAADSAGSGITRENLKISEWLQSAFNEKNILTGKDIEEKVINPRIRDINRYYNFKWHSFQTASETLPQRTLLLAPCGSGKTLAAWKWIQGQLSKIPAAKVIFLYPTRGTATEGFRDYVSWAPEADAALIHGTSAYELDGMFENPLDEKSKKDFTTDDRLFSIGFWPKSIFSATVDQFLGFMQYNYRSLCSIPLLVDSVIVIDEVHSFDEMIFASLRKFLQFFNVPVLCMTASLTSNRRKILQSLGLTVFPNQEESMDFDDLEKSAEMKRYNVSCDNTINIVDKVLEKEREGKKILWVVNTVDRCQQLAQKYNAICYHSRFKLDDRKKRHSAVINAFKSSTDSAVLAITTQVCEMSLDLDADILISEFAPVTSLIQRMGRCNRHSKPEDDKLGDVYIYNPANILPYKKEMFSGVDLFLADISGKRISQRDLDDKLDLLNFDAKDIERYTAFTESGHWASNNETHFREENDFTINSLLDCDITAFLELKKQKKPTDGLFVPVPKGMTIYNNELRQCVADGSKYSDKYGFLKRGEK